MLAAMLVKQQVAGRKACYFAIIELFAILAFFFLPDNVTIFIYCE